MAMPNSEEARRFYRCAHIRREEAQILLKAEQATVAVYLAGYVVELMLKALIIESIPLGRRPIMVENLKKVGHYRSRLIEIYRLEGGGRPPVEIARELNYVGDL